MIPEYNTSSNSAYDGNITKTYFLDIDKGRIYGSVSGKEAMKQAILKAINTKRYAFEIYNWNYGSQVHELIGENMVKAEMLVEGYIEDTLLADSRIEKIENFSLSRNGKNSMSIKFDAVTISGIIGVETEADISV